MSQIKIYGLANTIQTHKAKLSDAIHQALVTALQYPVEKKFQRFFALERADFIFPNDRSNDYLIIEVLMFEDRSTSAKKLLIQTLFQNIQNQCSISTQDVEITIIETPKENWGIRGQCGDELALNYKVDV